MRKRTNKRVCFVRFLAGLALLAAGFWVSGCSSNTQLKTSKFAYVPNLDDGTISAYSIDSSTGALSVITGSPFQAGSAPLEAATDSSGKFLFVAGGSGNGNGTVSVFTIDASTGVLSEITGSPFAGSDVAESIVVDPLSRFVFVGDFRGNILVYSLNSSTGALVPVPGSPFGGLNILTAIAEDPAGKFLYAVVPDFENFQNGSVFAFSIDASSGTLTPVSGSPVTTGQVPVAASVNQAGTLLYVANSTSNDVSGFAITASTGALTPVTGSPFSTGASEGAHSVTFDPSGAFVYVANQATQDVTVFGVNATTGALTAVQGSPFMSGGNGPIASAVDPSGTFLYIANRASGTVSAFTVSNTGALTAIAGSPFAAGTEPFSIALATPK